MIVQRGFAVILVLGLIAALALISLFALEQAQREQQFARLAAEGLQVKQSCLSLGSIMMRRAVATPLVDWPTLGGNWCLDTNAILSQSCPGQFAGVENRASLTLPEPTRLTITTSLSSNGINCGEAIDLEFRAGEVLVTKRLRTGG